MGIEDFFTYIEIFGTVAFAMSGAFAGMQRRLDPFGIIIIAFVTSVGGGTIRDLLLDAPVFWMHDIFTCFLIFFTAVIVMLYKSVERDFKVTLFLFDTLGLGLFTVIGLTKGIEYNLNPFICVTLGTITGSFGGLIRDILLNRIPLILRKEIYATASIGGGCIYFILYKYSGIEEKIIVLITIATILIIRTMAVKYHLEFPSIYSNKTT